MAPRKAHKAGLLKKPTFAEKMKMLPSKVMQERNRETRAASREQTAVILQALYQRTTIKVLDQAKPSQFFNCSFLDNFSFDSFQAVQVSGPQNGEFTPEERKSIHKSSPNRQQLRRMQRLEGKSGCTVVVNGEGNVCLIHLQNVLGDAMVHSREGLLGDVLVIKIFIKKEVIITAHKIRF